LWKIYNKNNTSVDLQMFQIICHLNWFMFFLISVGISTGYGLDGQVSILGSRPSGKFWVHSAAYGIGTEGSFPGV
jgi:hypothetical protein